MKGAILPVAPIIRLRFTIPYYLGHSPLFQLCCALPRRGSSAYFNRVQSDSFGQGKPTDNAHQLSLPYQITLKGDLPGHKPSETRLKSVREKGDRSRTELSYSFRE